MSTPKPDTAATPYQVEFSFTCFDESDALIAPHSPIERISLDHYHIKYQQVFAPFPVPRPTPPKPKPTSAALELTAITSPHVCATKAGATEAYRAITTILDYPIEELVLSNEVLVNLASGIAELGKSPKNLLAANSVRVDELLVSLDSYPLISISSEAFNPTAARYCTVGAGSSDKNLFTTHSGMPGGLEGTKASFYSLKLYLDKLIHACSSDSIFCCLDTHDIPEEVSDARTTGLGNIFSLIVTDSNTRRITPSRNFSSAFLGMIHVVGRNFISRLCNEHDRLITILFGSPLNKNNQQYSLQCIQTDLKEAVRGRIETLLLNRASSLRSELLSQIKVVRELDQMQHLARLAITTLRKSRQMDTPIAVISPYSMRKTIMKKYDYPLNELGRGEQLNLEINLSSKTISYDMSRGLDRILDLEENRLEFLAFPIGHTVFLEAHRLAGEIVARSLLAAGISLDSGNQTQVLCDFIVNCSPDISEREMKIIRNQDSACNGNTRPSVTSNPIAQSSSGFN